MDLGIALAVFPVIFIGELPDKSMLASLVMATNGKPRSVWMGAAGAFLVHVVIATTIGVGLFHVLPHGAVGAVVALLFLGGAAYAIVESNKDDSKPSVAERASDSRVVVTAFVVIFLAEWGDLTQILIANLAARYHSVLSVGLASLLALWTVAALAVAGGQSLLRFVNITTVRRITALMLLILAGLAAWEAIR